MLEELDGTVADDFGEFSHGFALEFGGCAVEGTLEFLRCYESFFVE